MDFTLRPATPNDDLAPLIAAAFAEKAFSDGSEATLPTELETAGALTLSLVAEHDGELIGQVTVSPAQLNDQTGWHAIGPISVAPKVQRMGIGSAMMNAALEHLRAAKSLGVLLTGDPRYYARFGFRNDAGLECADTPAKNTMGIGLEAPLIAGEVQFHPVFDAA